jgi:signal transduction histidine kinase
VTDRSKVKELALKVESGDIGDTRATFRVKKKDHSISWVEARITHARINDDRIAVVSSFGVTARKQAEKEIHKLSERIINIKEAERARLAADLHDELGQKLAAIHLEIDLLHGMIKPEDLKQQQSCQNITENVEKIATILRRNSLYKRPQMLNKVFLVTAVKQHIEDFNHSFPAIKVSFRRMGFKTRLAPEVELAIYRVIQESMTNIAKHAKANSVDIILTYNHPYVYLTISDDGIGFMNARDERFSKNSKEGIGLYSMKDRITSLGGIFDVKTTRGKGTVIRAEIPV